MWYVSLRVLGFIIDLGFMFTDFGALSRLHAVGTRRKSTIWVANASNKVQGMECG